MSVKCAREVSAQQIIDVFKLTVVLLQYDMCFISGSELHTITVL